MSIIAEKEMSDGKISVFEDGHVLYEDMDNYTIFPISECKEHHYTSLSQYEGRTSKYVPYENMEYTPEYLLNQDWAVALTLIGMDRIESNPKVHFVILHCMWVRRLLSKDKSSRIS